MKTVLLIAAVFAAAPLSAVAADAPSNIVFIMADDLGWADVAFHGGNAPTPTLDKLAAEGLELTQHYSAPVCSPTRAGLLTGRCWSRFGVTFPQNNLALPMDTVTLPRALKTMGYDTCLSGKWHLGSKPEWGPNHFGFDHSYGSLAGGVGPWNHFYKRGPFSETWHRNEQLQTDEGHVTDLIANEAVEWLEDCGDRPFFLYVPFTAVHLPLQEPPEWLARVPKEITGDVARNYAASVMHLDGAVARIVAALEKSGKRENTLLVFTSDNGGSTAQNNDTSYPPDAYPSGKLVGNNAPLRGEKGQLYEGGIRVPTVVHWPGKIKPGKNDTPVQIIDWTPTFCALAEYAPERDLKWDGVDLAPVLFSNGLLSPRTLYWAGVGFQSRAVRAGDWKLIVHSAKNAQRTELFNLADDPSESKDVAPTMPEKVAELQSALSAASRADRDAVAKPMAN